MTLHEVHAELMRSHAELVRTRPRDMPRGLTLNDVVTWQREWNAYTLAIHDWNEKWHQYLLARIETLSSEEKKMDAAVTKLETDLAKLKTDVTNGFATLKQQIADLLANQGNLPTEVVAKLNEMDATVTGLDASVNPTT